MSVGLQGHEFYVKTFNYKFDTNIYNMIKKTFINVYFIMIYNILYWMLSSIIIEFNLED